MAEPYDPNVAQDNTGRPFAGVPHQERATRRLSLMFKNPQILQCPNCRSDRLMVFADNARSNLIQFRCGNAQCRTWWKPVGMVKPQMNDPIAKALGLWVPDTVPDARYQTLEGWEDGRFADLSEEQEER